MGCGLARGIAGRGGGAGGQGVAPGLQVLATVSGWGWQGPWRGLARAVVATAASRAVCVGLGPTWPLPQLSTSFAKGVPPFHPHFLAPLAPQASPRPPRSPPRACRTASLPYSEPSAPRCCSAPRLHSTGRCTTMVSGEAGFRWGPWPWTQAVRCGLTPVGPITQPMLIHMLPCC